MEHVMKPELTRALRTLRLPVFALQHGAQAALAANEGWTFDRYLLALCELELQQRQTHRIQKLLLSSRLPREKTLATFERSRLKKSVERHCWLVTSSSGRRMCWSLAILAAAKRTCCVRWATS